MNVTQVGEIHNCDCGFSWRTGKSGSHECGYGLRKQLADLKAQSDALAAENAALKSAAKETLAHWAAAENGQMVQAMDKCMPNLRVAYCETPATDAYLNSVRADGVEMFASKATLEGSTFRIALAGFAAELRAGKDGE